MTTAKISSKLPSSHGLTRRLADAVYDARTKGDPTDDLYVVGRLSAAGHAEDHGKQSVTFEIASLEVIDEHYERENLRDLITKASDDRHGTPQLPLDFDTRSVDEQRRHLLGMVDEWAAEQDPPLTPGDVAERWRSHWSIGDGEPESPDGAFPNPNIDKAAPHHIREWALMVGAIADEPVTDDDEVDGKTRASGA